MAEVLKFGLHIAYI